MDENKVLIDEQNLYDIADAIRRKNGDTTKYLPDEMPPAIDAIPTGSGASLAGNLAVAYDELTFPVVIGTHCIYEDMYYVSVVPIESSEPFTPSHWTHITAGVEIEAIKHYIHDMSPIATVGPMDVVSVSDAAPLDADGLVVGIEPVQEGTGDPSPDNIRPITGWTGAKVAKCGKNLFDQNDTTYLAKDAHSYGASDDRALAQINTLPAGTYTLSFIEKIVSLNEMEPVGTRFGLYLRATSGEQTFNVNAQTNLITPTVEQIITKSVTFTLTDEYVGKFQYFYVYTGKNTSYPLPNEYTANIYDVQLEPGSTATAYEPYVGSTYDITFPSAAGTVYGGTLDVVKGEMKSYPYYASYNGEPLIGPWVSSMDKYVEGAVPTIGAQVVDFGATPITYQLTPQEITLLRGNNTIYADCGNTTLSYRQDVGLLLQALIVSIRNISP